MTLDTIYSKVFNLKKGEEKTVFLLTGYSFFMGLAYAYFYTTSVTLFLSKFDIKMLPYAYMAQGLVSYLVWLSYKRLEKYVIFSKMFVISGIFLLISVILLTSGYLLTENKWYAFMLIVWYNIFLLLNGISFWGIATKIFDLRQAKRLFGLIGSGEVFARVISFLSVPLLLTVFKTDQLLYFSILGLIAALILTPIIINNLSGRINIQKTAEVVEVVKVKSSNKGLGRLMENKYFGLIFILALFPLFATFYIDFMFLGQIKLQYTNAKVISSFLSIFMGTMSVAEFILRTFVSGRLLTKYGILFGILVLPLTLALSTSLAAVYGSFYGAMGLFFSFIILSRLFIRMVRTLFFDPSFQILYQPIAIEDRLVLQSKVEGVSKSIGFILAGALLLLLAHAKFLNIVHYNYIFLAVLAVWIWISVKLYHEYRGSLKSVLANLISSKSDRAGELAFASFSGFMASSGAYKTNIALNLTERTHPSLSGLLMLRLLPKAAPDIQTDILSRIAYKRISPAVRVIDFCLTNNPEQESATQFLQTKAVLLDKQGVEFKAIAALAQSANAAERLHAVRLMDYNENYNNYKLLIQLLQDDNIRVRNTALITCGRLRKRELWPYVIENLNNPHSAYAALIAIKEIGEPILNELVTFFNKDNIPKNTQIKLIKLFADMNGRQIIRLLKSKINLADDSIRKHIFSTLSSLQFQFSPAEQPLIKNYIEEDIDCLAWIVASILDIGNDEQGSLLKKGLELELAGKKDFVFLQLSMMYDQKTINYFIDGFEDASQESRAYALEVLDMIVPPHVKDLFLPLLTELNYDELLKAYDAHFTQERLPVKDRLIDIINKSYSKINIWNKACAMNLLATYDDTEKVLLANALNDSALLSETALWVLFNKNPQSVNEFLDRIKPADNLKVNAVLKYFPQISKSRLLLFDVINRLKQNSFFSELTEFELVPVAEWAKQVFVAAGTQFTVTENELEDLFFVLDGGCDIHTTNGLESMIAYEMYWYIQSGSNISELSFTAKADTIILQINSNTMFELLAEHINLSKKIINVLSKQKA